MARLAEQVSVGILLVVALAFALFPAEMSYLLGPGIGLIVDATTWASVNLPRPVFLGVIFLVTAAVTIMIGISTARVLYTVSRHAGPRTRWLVDKVTPSSPIGKGAFAFGFTICFLIGSVWALPYVIGDLSQSSGVANTSDVVNSNESGSILDETERRALRVLNKDAVSERQGYDGPPYERPRPDTDGDRLKDSWERAGETPAGVALPGADPRHKDLYVQVNYGGGTLPLSDREKRQLRQVWAAMPVDNPDGSQGIDLHIDDGRPKGGLIGQTVVYDGVGDDETTRFYTRRFLGDRLCRYHQVVVGQIRNDGLAGRASAPGYGSYVDTERLPNYVELTNKKQFEREVSPRVHVITHELLHNVVGDVSGQSHHTDQGWLYPRTRPSEAFLSDATARAINQRGLAGSGYYQYEVCASG